MSLKLRPPTIQRTSHTIYITGGWGWLEKGNIKGTGHNVED
jgi:hypothetical protein